MKKPTKPTLKNAVLAKCHNCMAHYQDGIRDCQVTSCPLYPWMPRAKLQPDLEWLDYNPRRQDLVRWEDCQTRELSDEQKQQAAERLRRAREVKDYDLGDLGL